MKLIRFSIGDDAIHFGLVIGDRAVSFETLMTRSGRTHTELQDSDAYLQALPASEKIARELLLWGQDALPQFSDVEKPVLAKVTLHAPVAVRALFDFGLTPRHLANTVDTMGKYEQGNPQTLALLDAIRKMLLAPKQASAPGQPERLSYYKCNLNAVSGHDVTVPWPVYTSYLDIEPELAVVYGNAQQPVAGYCIFNDVSARDVQVPEIIGGFCLPRTWLRAISSDHGWSRQMKPVMSLTKTSQ